jgi:CHAT domain-containing protein
LSSFSENCFSGDLPIEKQLSPDPHYPLKKKSRAIHPLECLILETMRLPCILLKLCLGLVFLNEEVSAQTKVTDVMEKAKALRAVGEFDSAYHLLQYWPDTVTLSQEEKLKLVLGKTINSIEARLGKPARDDMASLERLIQNTPGAIRDQTEYQLSLSEIYFKLGRNPEGCSCLESIRLSGIPSSSISYIQYSYLKGLCYSGHDTDSAITYLQTALDKLIKRHEDPSWLEARIRHMLGNILRDQDPEAAVQFYLREAQILEALFTPGHLEIAGAHYNAGNVYYGLMNYTQALAEYQKAYPGFSKRYETSDRYMRFINEAIGDMFWELGQKDSALVYYDLSVLGEEHINHDQGEKLNTSGDSLLKSGLSDQALKYYQSALAFRKEQFGSAHPLTGACNNFIARVYQRNGLTEEAMRIYQQSLFGFSTGFSDTSMYSNPAITQIQMGTEPFAIEALLAKAEGLAERYVRLRHKKDFNTAGQTLSLCQELVERSRVFPLTEGSRMFRSDMASPVYALAVRLALLAYRETRDENHLQTAFHALEKSKAYTLVQAMQFDAKGYKGVPADLLNREKLLKQAIADYTGKVVREQKRCAESRDKQLILWKNKLDHLYSDYSALIRQIKQAYPDYYSMRHSMDVISLSELKENITKKTLVISLFEGDDLLTLFAISSDTTLVREYPIDSSFHSKAESLLRLLKAPAMGNTTQTGSWNEICSYFYKTYFADLIEALPTQQKLIFLPDGALAYFPLELFFTAVQDNRDPSLRFLDTYAISYAPSATVLAQYMQTRGNSFSSFTGIAPDYGSRRDGADRGSSVLKYNSSEINQLALLFRKPQLFTGEISNERFLELCASADILHLAMHAEIDPQEPMLSAFLLGEADTQKVYAYEIQSLSLRACHAVLSACNTGVGQLRKGEGMMSLSRCFQYAGCQSMVVSLWPVDDQATSELMQYYYQHLLEGMPKDIALQKAKMDFLRSADPLTSHPYYWAGFVLIGNTAPLKMACPVAWWIWMVIGTIILTGIYVYRKYFIMTPHAESLPET